MPLTNEQFLEIAARERTFDLAYTRSALGMLATGIFIYRIFQEPFLPIAIVFVALGLGYYLVVVYRRYFYTRSIPPLLRASDDENVFEMYGTTTIVDRHEHVRERVTSSHGSSLPNVRLQEVTQNVKVEVTVPMIPPSTRNIENDALRFYQTPTTFVTSGGVVAVTALLTAVAELLCLGFLVAMY